MKNKNINNENDVILAKWLANEITDSEFKNLVSEKDFISYKKIKKGINAYDFIEDPLDKSYKNLASKIDFNKSTKVKSLYKKWAFSIAASLLLLIGLNYFFKAITIKYSTGFGEQKTFAMLDGSQVTLNANSVLSYNKILFSKKRNVFLKGEAFFKVHKGKTFKVKTPNGSVQVLGTDFSVTSYKDFFKVHCYSGKVKVVQQGVFKTLQPNQIYLKINKKVYQIAFDNTKLPYWLNGETSFKSTPAKYVFMAFKNQYQTDIDASKINNTILFTGTFPNKNKKVALDIIANTLGLKYKIKDTKIVFEKR